MFPPCVEDFISPTHPANLVKRLVCEELDLREIAQAYEETRGAPPFPPEMMTCILLYAYMRSEYSSRKIARACEERMDFIALAALNRPDFRTIANFRKRHHKALEGLFKQVVKLCKEAGLIDLKHVAVDGSKIQANASSSKNQSDQRLIEQERMIEKSIQEWFEKAQSADHEEDQEFGPDERGDVLGNAKNALERIREAKKRIEERDQKAREERSQAEKEGTKPKSKLKSRNAPKATAYENKTAPDSRLMKSRSSFIQSYKAQVAVDSKKLVIISQHISTNGNDRNEIKPALRGIVKNCRQLPKELSADADFSSEENFKALHKKKVRAYIAIAENKGPPSGQFTRAMLKRLKQGGKRTRYALRKQVVEPVFGTIKAARGYRQFLLRGCDLVSAEWALVCTAYNLCKLLAARA